MKKRSLLNPSPRVDVNTKNPFYWIGRVITYLILAAWSLFTIFALSWVTLASFKSNREVFREPLKLPAEFLFENYVKAWNSIHLGEYLQNSILIVSVSLVMLMLVSAPAAYVLSRFKFKGSKILSTLFVAGIGIPYPLVFVPLFGILTRMKLVNSIPGLIIVYVSLSIPFTVFLLTGFFATLPKEMEEAAIIDGCSDWQVFWKVMMPLASPGILTASIFNGIGLWNEYQLALIFLNDSSKRPLSLGLYAMKNAMQYTGDWPGLFAGVVIVMIPTIFLYIFLSERMISGITMGAVK